MLMDDLAGPEGDLIGLHRLLGGAPPQWAALASFAPLAAALSNPDRLRERLESLYRGGYRATLAKSDSRLFATLGRRASGSLPAVLPIVPNIEGFMREAVEYGMVGAGLRRVWRMGPVALTSLGLRSVGRLGALARRDFATMLRSFIELELADFSPYRPPLIFLQPQMTDLAVAMNNPRLLEAFVEAVASRTGAAAGVATFNFAPLMARLKSWGVEVAAILAPWDARGTHMRPDAEACVQASKAIGLPIWAERAGRPDAPSPEDRAAMARGGLTGAVRDDLALWSQTE